MNDRRAFFGTIAMSTVSVAKLGLQLLVLPLMARVLGPEAFGIIGLAWPFIVFASVLTDAGLGTPLVREKNASRELEATVFWISTAIGTISAVLLCILAWPLAAAFSRPDLAPVLAALSPILMIGGSMTVPTARITRSRNFTIFAIGDILSVGVSAIAGLLAAYLGYGVWSLVIQQLVLWITKAAWLFSKSNFSLAFCCKPFLANRLLGFGTHCAAANFADLAGKYLPPLIVGGWLGVTTLGHYAMASQLMRVPEMVISGPIYLAIFTAVAQAPNRQAARAMVFSSFRILLTVLALTFCGLGLTADLVTDLLLGAGWSDTAPMLAALAPAGFFVCLYSFLGAVLLGSGNSSQQFKLTLFCSLAMVIGALSGAQFGPLGVALGVSLGAAALAPFYLRSLAHELGASVASFVLTSVAPLTAACVMVLTVAGIRMEIAELPMAVQLAISVAAGVLSFVPVVILLGGRKFLEDLRRIRPQAAELESELQPSLQAAQTLEVSR